MWVRCSQHDAASGLSFRICIWQNGHRVLCSLEAHSAMNASCEQLRMDYSPHPYIEQPHWHLCAAIWIWASEWAGSVSNLTLEIPEPAVESRAEQASDPVDQGCLQRWLDTYPVRV